MKSAILVVALVAALAFVCEADEKFRDPLSKLVKIMDEDDEDGDSLIEAWENEYKDSEPESEKDQIFKETLQLFAQYFLFKVQNGCTQENVDVLNKVKDLVDKYNILLSTNLKDAVLDHRIEYEIACKKLLRAK